MSQWTHAIGTIQCRTCTKEEVERIMGKPVLWNDHLDIKYGTPKWEDYHKNVWCRAFEENEKGRGIPMGSEGSMEWYLVDTSKNNENVAGEGTLIAIEGDLRDYGGEAEVQYIIQWFRKAVDELGGREAILKIHDEWTPYSLVIMYNWALKNPVITKIGGAN